MSGTGCQEKPDELTSLLTRPRTASARSFLVKYQVLTSTLHTIDEEHPDDLESGGQHEGQDSINVQVIRSWRVGLFLALASGILFTSTNFMIQYFEVEALEILLVRSIFQVLK